MNTRKTNKIIILLTSLGILIAIVFGLLQYFKRNKPSQFITGSDNVQINQEGNSNVVNINKKEIDRIIRSLEFRITLDSFPKQGIAVRDGQSIGVASVVGLFSDKKVRYRFITNYKYSISKIEHGRQRITLIYTPESPEQIIGKRMDFLKNMDVLGINYSEFLNKINLNVDEKRPVIFNFDVVLNGIKVISMSKKISSKVILNGKGSFDMREYFDDIDDKYKKIIAEQDH